MIKINLAKAGSPKSNTSDDADGFENRDIESRKKKKSTLFEGPLKPLLYLVALSIGMSFSFEELKDDKLKSLKTAEKKLILDQKNLLDKKEKAQNLTQTAEDLDTEIRNVQSRLDLFEQHDQKRNELKKVLVALSQQIGEMTYLSEVLLKDHQLKIEGRAIDSDQLNKLIQGVAEQIKLKETQPAQTRKMKEDGREWTAFTSLFAFEGSRP